MFRARIRLGKTSSGGMESAQRLSETRYIIRDRIVKAVSNPYFIGDV